MNTIKVKLTTTEGMLGTSPFNEEIYRDFIGSKSPDASTLEDEVAALGTDAVTEKGMTGFPRDDQDRPFIYDYQIKGFFKDACSMLNRVGGKGEDGKKKKLTESSKLTAFKKVIDGMIFVSPRKIPIHFTGDVQLCQRPLRAQTMQGERIALAISEEVPAGASLTFDITVLDESHLPAIREWLDYGALRGLGQWRNSGKGRFVWEELS